VSQSGPPAAEQRLEELETLLGRVVHDLRTPLTIISGFVDTLLSLGDEADPEQRRQMLERVQRAAERLDGLLEELVAAVVEAE